MLRQTPSCVFAVPHHAHSGRIQRSAGIGASAPSYPSRFSVSVERPARTLLLAGDFDAAALAAFAAAVTGVAMTGSVDVTVDLRDVRFVDAAGMSALVRLRKDLACSDNIVTVRHPLPSVRRAFDAAALTELLGQ